MEQFEQQKKNVRILGWGCPFLFFQYSQNVTPLSSSLHCYQEKYALILIFALLYMICLFLGAAFKIFCLWLVLNNLIMMCFGVVFFTFLVLRDSGASWICEFIDFIKFVKLWPLFLQILFVPLPILLWGLEVYIKLMCESAMHTPVPVFVFNLCHFA